MAWFLQVVLVLVGVALLLRAVARWPVFFRYLFLGRYQLLVAAFLVLLPVLCVGLAPSLLENLLVLNPTALGLVAGLAFLASWVVMVSSDLLARYGYARFAVPEIRVPGWISRWRLFWFGLLAVPLVATAWVLSPGSNLRHLVAVLLGAVGAWLVLVVALVIQITALEKGSPDSDLLAPMDSMTWRILFGKRGLLRWLRERTVPWLGWIAGARAEPPVGAGEDDALRRAGVLAAGYRARDGGLLAGHLVAGVFFTVQLAVYAAGYWWLRPSAEPGFSFPSLGYVLVILILLGWVLPGLAFLFDRVRVPVVLLILLGSLVLHQVRDSHHVYRTWEATGDAATLAGPLPGTAAVAAGETGLPGPTPGTAGPERGGTVADGAADTDAAGPPDGGTGVGNSRAGDSRAGDTGAGESAGGGAPGTAAPPREPPFVVVAASGGGIAAAQWTARVLAGFQCSLGPDFADSLLLISSASGGSVGALHYLDRFDPAGPPDEGELRELVLAAGEPSLDAVAWGLAYPDVWRVIGAGPGRSFLDRGWAKEQAWARELTHPDRWLSEWRRGARDLGGGNPDAWLPTVVFNATEMETGGPFRLDTFPSASPWPHRSFFGRHPGHDLPVVTAARLSATFPWVTPIGRGCNAGSRDRIAAGVSPLGSDAGDCTGPLPGTPFLADGGYYDNYGVAAVVEWLERLLGESPADLESADELEALRRRGLLVVRVRLAEDEPRRKAPGSWVTAVAGPVLTLFNARSTSQRARNELELEMVLGRLKERGVEHRSVEIFHTAPVPLSWKLTAEEAWKIRNGWNAENNQKRLGPIHAFFTGVSEGGPVPDCAIDLDAAPFQEAPISDPPMGAGEAP